MPLMTEAARIHTDATGVSLFIYTSEHLQLGGTETEQGKQTSPSSSGLQRALEV